MTEETNIFEELKETDLKDKQIVAEQEPESLVLSKDIEEIEINNDVNNGNFNSNNNASARNNDNEYTRSTKFRNGDKLDTEGLSDADYKKNDRVSNDYDKSTNKRGKKDNRNYLYNDNLFISRREMRKQKMDDGENVLKNNAPKRGNTKKNDEKLKQVRETNN